MHSLRLMPDQQVVVSQDGSYRMTLPGEGRFHLVAREQSGKAPFKGELYGLYEGDRDHAVIFGAVPSSADIVVSRLMSDEPISSQTRVDSPGRRTAAILRVANVTIDGDTVWQGDVEVTGTVLVRRGATLSIRPGTTVRFVRTDSNGDGIGDGEIRVLGRLVAHGTKGKPVRFRSASKRPRPGDWSYLLVFASAGETSLRHAIVEDAFSGLQVHFSRARVTDSVFRNNREGIRFGRAELVIENNEITKNRYGIRHTRLEGSILIRYNAIYGNHVGIFLVPSNQNIVDFSETYVVRDRPARDQPIVCYNNLAGNRLYDYQFGERQGYDVDLAGNWWGSTDIRSIRRKIYDREVDPTLGSARIFPVLRAPARRAGVGKGGP
jgi:plastocyanin